MFEKTFTMVSLNVRGMRIKKTKPKQVKVWLSSKNINSNPNYENKTCGRQISIRSKLHILIYNYKYL